MSAPVTDEQGRRCSTFPLLWCENCKRAEEPEPLHVPVIAASAVLTCNECDEPLTQLRCFVDGDPAPHVTGDVHRNVATLASVDRATRR